MAEIKPVAWMGINPDGGRHYTSCAHNAVEWERGGVQVVPLCRHDSAVSEINALCRDNEAFIAANTELVSENEKLREALASIYLYANDTLSGPANGLQDDRLWHRYAVIECRNRARAALKGDTHGN